MRRTWEIKSVIGSSECIWHSSHIYQCCLVFIRKMSDICQKNARYLLTIQRHMLFLNLLSKHQMKSDDELSEVFWHAIWWIKDSNHYRLKSFLEPFAFKVNFFHYKAIMLLIKSNSRWTGPLYVSKWIELYRPFLTTCFQRYFTWKVEKHIFCQSFYYVCKVLIF